MHTWINGEIIPGVSTVESKRWGPVVCLGEQGRGQKSYVEVAMHNRFPPESENGRIIKAALEKIVLSAKEGGPEKTFFVLRKPEKNDKNIYVRICTQAGCNPGTGKIKTIEGRPKILVKGSGAYGAEGKGSWVDALVALAPESFTDVIKICPARSPACALWVEDGQPQTALWEVYEKLRAEKMAEVAREKNLMIQSTPLYIFHGGISSAGIKLQEGETGRVLRLGTGENGGTCAEIPFLVPRDNAWLTHAGVVKLENEGAVPESGRKAPADSYALTTAPRIEKTGTILALVSTVGPYHKESTGVVEVRRGNPVLLAAGTYCDRTKGIRGTEELWVLRKNDVLYVRQEGGYKVAGPWALYVEKNELRSRQWEYWEKDDAEENPENYLQKNLSTPANVPESWIGRMVEAYRIEQTTDGFGPQKPFLALAAQGELVKVKPYSGRVIINTGGDGKEEFREEVRCDWVYLDEKRQVKSPEEGYAQERERLCQELEVLQERARRLVETVGFGSIKKSCADAVRALKIKSGFKEMSNEDISRWIQEAEKVLRGAESLLASHEPPAGEKKAKPRRVVMTLSELGARLGPAPGEESAIRT